MKKESVSEIKQIKKNKTYSKLQIKEIAELLKRKDEQSKIIHHSLIVIGIAYAWEVVELYMETAVFKNYGIERFFAEAQVWFSGVEIFINRFVIDVALVYFGWYFVRQKMTLSKIAAPISLTWLMVHIFIFKDSMFLHKHTLHEIMQVLINIDLLYVLGGVTIITLIMNKFKDKLGKE